MFSSTKNETIQNLTEKTKLIAQIISNSQCIQSDVKEDEKEESLQNKSKIKSNAVDGFCMDDLKYKCICACKGTIGRLRGKKCTTSSSKERTTKWYIKVNIYTRKKVFCSNTNWNFQVRQPKGNELN